MEAIGKAPSKKKMQVLSQNLRNTNLKKQDVLSQILRHGPRNKQTVTTPSFFIRKTPMARRSLFTTGKNFSMPHNDVNDMNTSTNPRRLSLIVLIGGWLKKRKKMFYERK